MITTSHYDLKQSEPELDTEQDDPSKADQDYQLDTDDQLDLELYMKDAQFEDEIEYGMVATSAPAILDQQDVTTGSNRPESAYSFYSSTSMIKLNTFNLVSKINESSSRVNSTNELATAPTVTVSRFDSKEMASPMELSPFKSSKLTVSRSQKLKFKDEEAISDELLNKQQQQQQSSQQHPQPLQQAQSVLTPKSQIKSCIKSSAGGTTGG